MNVAAQQRLLRKNAVWAPRWMRSPLRSIVLAVLSVLVFGGTAYAHAQIDVGNGRYVMEIGFRDEPAYAGQPNALSLSVQEFATGGAKPVDGLATTLSAEVSKDGQMMSLPLVPLGDGKYEGSFVPTATGDYTFHITGKIGDAAVDESLTSGPNTFDTVQPLSNVQFPVHTPDPADLAAQTAAASATAETARTIAIAGLVVGVLGLVAGGVALARGRRPQVEQVSAPLEPSGKLIR